MIILDVVQTIGPGMSKRNMPHTFQVPDSARELQLHFSYEPKELADREKAKAYIMEGLDRYAPGPLREGYDPWEAYLPLVNLLTLSLDSPDGYVGCAHRHTPVQQHTISAESASPGFLPCHISAGEWRAVVNVHAVVTDSCTYRLVVTVKG